MRPIFGAKSLRSKLLIKITTLRKFGVSAIKNRIRKLSNFFSDRILSKQTIIEMKSHNKKFLGFGSTPFHRTIALQGSYETFALKTILYYSNNKIFIDVGANIGYHSLIASTVAKGVISFEPTAATFDMLRRNIEINQADNILAYNVALGSEKGDGEIYIAEVSGWNSIVTPHGEQKEKIKIVDFDSLEIDTSDIGLVKIDVEGYEIEVIRGMSNLVHKRSCNFIIECNPDWINVDELLSIFSGRELYIINEKKQRFEPFSNRYGHFPCNILVR